MSHELNGVKVTDMTDSLKQMDRILTAAEQAMGIRQTVVRRDDGKITVFGQEADPRELQRLYRDPQARPLIDKMVETGVLNKAMVDTLTQEVHHEAD